MFRCYEHVSGFTSTMFTTGSLCIRSLYLLIRVITILQHPDQSMRAFLSLALLTAIIGLPVQNHTAQITLKQDNAFAHPGTVVINAYTRITNMNAHIPVITIIARRSRSVLQIAMFSRRFRTGAHCSKPCKHV